MDWGSVFGAAFDTRFFLAVFSIILIDLVLAGDNAVVIAMAVRHLPEGQRRKGIALGAGAAVALRIAATFFVAQLLTIPFVKLAGGVAILWIAIKLFLDAGPEEDSSHDARTLWQTVRLIVIADISLSIDNMLAVGGASGGNFFLLLFGLIVSVPFVVFTSGVLSGLMTRYPIIVVGGAALLGTVGADMIVTDAIVAPRLALGRWATYVLQGGGAVGVLVAGRMLAQGRIPRAARRTEPRVLSVTRV